MAKESTWRKCRNCMMKFEVKEGAKKAYWCCHKCKLEWLHQQPSYIQDKLMDLVKDYVKKRDDYTCQRCGKENLSGHDCQGSHVVPESHHGRIAYDPIDLKTLCYRCHTWWHENPTESGEWFKAKFPDRWEILEEAKSKPVVPIEATEWQAMYDNFLALTETMKNA